VAVSQPHFFNGDPSLLNEVEGMNPDEQKHQTYAIIQPVRGQIGDISI
jgi:scavenger receptor class B, member 1